MIKNIQRDWKNLSLIGVIFLAGFTFATTVVGVLNEIETNLINLNEKVKEIDDETSLNTLFRGNLAFESLDANEIYTAEEIEAYYISKPAGKGDLFQLCISIEEKDLLEQKWGVEFVNEACSIFNVSEIEPYLSEEKH